MPPADPDSAEQRAVRRASKIAIPVMCIGFVMMVLEVITTKIMNGGDACGLVLGVLWSAFLSAMCLGIWLQCAGAVGRRWGKSEGPDTTSKPPA